MSATRKISDTLSPEIRSVVEGLVSLLQPHRIYLYNQRVGAAGKNTGFKLCVVADMPDKQEAETAAYLAIDSDIPYDLLLYTQEEWTDITGRDDSFANKIHRTGTVVYG